MGKGTRMQRCSAFLAGAALIIFLIVFGTLMISAHFVTAQEVVWHIQPPDQILFWPDNPFVSGMFTLAALVVMMLADMMLRKFHRFHLTQILSILWIGVAVLWVWGAQLVPHADFEMVVESAKAFARNDFSIFFEHPYYHDCTYQLGFCLVMEGLLRLFPSIDLALTMEMINAGIVMLTAVVLSLFIRDLEDSKDRYNTSMMLYFLFIPMVFFCSYVYGTILMMFLIACAFMCFLRYAKCKKNSYGLMCALSIGLAVMIKPNAMIAVAALCIIALLQAMKVRDIRGIGYVFAGALIAVLLPKMVAWFYEVRSGVKFEANLSMLSRLTMGFQDARSGPGWYNNYVAYYSSTIIPLEESQPIHMQNLIMRMKEFAQNPAMFVEFMRDKCYSMWLEPTYSTLWNGSLSAKNGPYNGMVIQLCREGMPLRALLEKYMDAFQQAMYVLACIGTYDSLKKRRDPLQVLLPVMVLGGFLYHMLFEAKSQYIFVYAFFMMPLAAQGLHVLEAWICRKWKEKRVSRWGEGS